MKNKRFSLENLCPGQAAYHFINSNEKSFALNKKREKKERWVDAIVSLHLRIVSSFLSIVSKLFPGISSNKWLHSLGRHCVSLLSDHRFPKGDLFFCPKFSQFYNFFLWRALWTGRVGDSRAASVLVGRWRSEVVVLVLTTRAAFEPLFQTCSVFI